MKTYNFYTIVFLGFALLVIILLVSPQYQNWRFSSIRLKEFKKAEERQREHFNNLRQSWENLEKYRSSLLKINTALPESANLPELLNFIQKLAGQVGLSLKKINSIETKKASSSTIKETRIEINLTGSYPAFKSFLTSIEKSARLIEVESINFSYPTEMEKKLQEEQVDKKDKLKIFEFQVKIKVNHY